MATEIAQKIVHIHLPADEPFKTTLTAGSHELISDEPVEVTGGKDQGPDPYDLLLMSLGTCTAMTMKMYARAKGWETGEIYIELRHHKDHAADCSNCEDPTSKIDKIEKEIIIKGALSKEQRDKLLEISKKCPVHRTLLNDIQIDSTISYE
ncbi:MAG: OsmC family protein [Bacteroidota bacterium]